MGILQVTPDQAVAGTLITISGSQLPANKKVELTWSTADATWLVQTEPDGELPRSLRYQFAVVLDTTTTNSSGAFKVSLKAPQDWGGLHDIYAVIDGVEEAHGGFITLRTVTVTPRSGPVEHRSRSPTAVLGTASAPVGHRCCGTTTTWAS